MATQLVRGMGSFFKGCACSRQNRCAHPYAIRYRDAAGRQREEAGYSTHQAALDRLMSGRTTIMIAHRLSTVRGADRIYVIEGGRVVQSGAHQDLMRRRGLYSRLATAQNLDMRPESTG